MLQALLYPLSKMLFSLTIRTRSPILSRGFVFNLIFANVSSKVFFLDFLRLITFLIFTITFVKSSRYELYYEVQFVLFGPGKIKPNFRPDAIE